MTFTITAWEKDAGGRYVVRTVRGPLHPLMLAGEQIGENGRLTLRRKARDERRWAAKWDRKARDWELTSRVRAGESIAAVARDLGMHYEAARQVCRRDGVSSSHASPCDQLAELAPAGSADLSDPSEARW